MKLILKYFLFALSIYATADLLPGIHIGSFGSAIIAALLLGLINITIKPLMIILTVPFTLITLGLFLLVINALMVMLAAWFLADFKIDGFWWALAFSIIHSLIASFLEKLILPTSNPQAK